MSDLRFPQERWIVLASERRGLDHTGRVHLVKRFEISCAGFVPDVYVRMGVDVLDLNLYDDSVFISFVNHVMRELGYAGPAFDRAELGMQGRDFIVLEPGREFREFVIKRFGWRDLAKVAKAY